MDNIIIYFQEGAAYETVISADTLISSIEEFHDLEFKKKPQLYLFRDSISYICLSPSKARFCTFPNSRIFLTPWALEESNDGEISLDIYLRHELSHSIIFQNTRLAGALKFPDWLLEGIAVYCSEQMGTGNYPGKDMVYELIARGNYMHPSDYKSKNEDKIILDVPHRINFIYSEFACIIDYLIEKYGREKFLNYIKGNISGASHDTVFREVYSIDFEIFLNDFMDFVSGNS